MIINACQKEELKPTQKLSSKDVKVELGLKQVYSEHGMLVFVNQKHLDNVKDELSLLDDNELCNWENNLGFVSMYRIYNNILDAENSQADYFDSLSDIEIKRLETSGRIYEYSKLATKYLKEGFIEVAKYEDGEYLKLKCFADYNAHILNENGLVKIGEEIWQFGKNKIKIIKDGDFGKISTLKGTKASSNGILVIHLFNDNTTFKTYPIDKDWSDNNSYGREKILAANRFIQYYYSGNTQFHTNFWAQIELQKYRWHKWRKQKGDAFIRGWYKWDDGTGVKTSYETHNFSGSNFYTYTYINWYSSVSGWVHAPKIVSTHLKYDRYGGPHGIHVWCYNFSTGRLF